MLLKRTYCKHFR